MEPVDEVITLFSIMLISQCDSVMLSLTNDGIYCDLPGFAAGNHADRRTKNDGKIQTIFISSSIFKIPPSYRGFRLD